MTPEDAKRRPVRARTVEADCEWLAIVCNWATEWEDRETGQPLLREHPLKRERFRDAVPHEQNPRRPVATQDRYEAIVAKAATVHPYLVPLLAIVNGAGRRISAVLQLRYEDVRLAKTAGAPYGAIQWPGESDKMGKAWAAPINAAVRATLDAVLAARPGLGGAYLFPSPMDPAQPMDRWFASKLSRAAPSGSPKCRSTTAHSGTPTGGSGARSGSTCRSRTWRRRADGKTRRRWRRFTSSPTRRRSTASCPSQPNCGKRTRERAPLFPPPSLARILRV